MTPEQEKRGAELFAAGASEREVATELGIGASSAHRLKLRLEAEQADPAAPELTEPEKHDEAVLQAADEVLTDEAMALLEVERHRLAGQLEAFQDRAQASWSAKQTLEQERDQLLIDTGDASGVDQRLEDADRDLRKWVRGAELITPQLAEVNARIGRLSGYRELASLRAELDAAVIERDEVHSRSGDRQRAAVAAVRAAAEEFCAVAAEERTTADRVASLASAVTQRAMQLGEAMPGIPEPQQTGLTARGNVAGPELALVQALTQARSGNVAAVARHLGEVNGQLPAGPPSAEERERWDQMAAAKEKELAELRERSKAGPQPIADHERVPVGTDHFGNPVDAHGNPLTLRHRMPHPADIWTSPGAFTSGGYGSSYRVGESPASY
jgi:transposase